ncbi:MAG: HlyC/CorC family transporter [Gammaproteobacteria bacterium]|nr:HlyC/CorC family transporter [Gammaproteobacteria bacterium]NNJ48973.1 HlyC/CorC family transporter [Gammaproteobacteria bacterium]
MNELSTASLFIILAILILLSGFFSGSETALMTLNRYRLKSLADKGHRGARLASKLLARPDRLLGLILLGNNIVNIFAATVATIIALRLYGEIGLAVAPIALAFVILIFSEVTPKTLAALKPEKLAFPSAFVYTVIATPLYPFVWLVNIFSNALLSLMGVHPDKETRQELSADELRAVVVEAEHFMPQAHSDMLLSIIDLEQVSVEDIMVPRNEVTGIDLNDDWNDIVHQITHSQRTRVPVFHDSIDNTVGVLHLRKVLNLFSRDELNMDTLKGTIASAYFIPAGTSLTQQLLNFQDNRRRSGLVVDEYGSIQGLVTLEDILEEIVGQFTTDSPTRNLGIHKQADNSYLIDGNTHIRDINRALDWQLPSDGPKTLNGLILEHMEIIPQTGTSLMIENYTIEIMRSTNNAVQTARMQDTSDMAETIEEDQAPVTSENS